MTASAAKPGQTRGRLGLIGFGVLALGMIMSPVVVMWWANRDACPRTVVAEGRSPLGMLWEISSSDCGPAVGTVWQVRIAGSGQIARVAYDARNGPRPLSIEHAQGTLTVRVDAPPPGEATPFVTVRLDHKMRPKDVARFVDGARRG
jgi:hypothetical protein